MPSYLLSFELDKKEESLLIRGDEMGLRRLSEMLMHVLDRTKEGHFCEEPVVLPKSRTDKVQGIKKLRTVNICCSRGDKPQS